jgi:hypothetical protein
MGANLAAVLAMFVIMPADVTTQLTVGGAFAIAILTVVFAFILRQQKLRKVQNEDGDEYAGPERRTRLAGNESTEYWRKFFSEEATRASMETTRTVVLPILKAMQTSINQTQVAIQSLAQSQAQISTILEILKDRDDQETIARAAAAAAAAATKQSMAKGAGI